MILGETIFDIVYLITVITIGGKMMQSSPRKSQYWLFGLMAVILGCGDAFHLVPRVWAMHTVGLDAAFAPLGFGQAVTSITMTIFYVLLYHIWEIRYRQTPVSSLRITVYVLAFLRILLCLFPQNRWMSPDAPLSWGIYRNIPFSILGVIVLVLFYKKAKETHDQAFRFMWLAIAISFACYLPVVLLAGKIPPIGALMIPKTCAYVWMVWMGYSALKNSSTSK